MRMFVSRIEVRKMEQLWEYCEYQCIMGPQLDKRQLTVMLKYSLDPGS